MAEAAAASSPSAAAVVAVLVLLVAPALALVARARWRRAAARQDDVRRLARLAAEEAEYAEREAALAYYAGGFPCAEEVTEAPVWTPPVVASVPGEAETAPALASAESLARGVCAVCYKPTTMRCKQCKAVKYCSFKCQIAHWRQGHKGQCCPPRSIDTRPDSGIKVSGTKKGKVEWNSVPEENVVVRVEPAAKINKSIAATPESSEANHAAGSLNTESKDMPLEKASITVSASDSGHAINKVRLCQNTGHEASFIPDTSKSGKKETHNEPSNPSEYGSYSESLGGLASLGKSQVGEQKIIGDSTVISNESIDCSRFLFSGKVLKVQDAAVSESSFQTAHSEKFAGNINSQGDEPLGLEYESSRYKHSVHVADLSAGGSQPEHSKKQVPGTDNLKSSKNLSSMSAVDKDSSICGSGCSIIPTPSKRVHNVPEIPLRSSENAGSTPNNLSTCVKKIIRQQAALKFVRHYPSELTLFPYELFVELYNFNKVELRPFGLCNLGNSCYANVVFQCLTFTRPLTAYLLEGLHSRNCSKKDWCFLCDFEKLIVEGKQGKSPLSPTGILSHLRDIGCSFGLGREEDAHEFLRYTIDTMQSVCLKDAKKNGSHQLAEETTLVQLIFGGYLRSKIKCSKCQVSSEQCERILDLTVEIDGDISTLEEALHRFTSTEVLDGENRYQCSRCKSYECAKKKLTISEAPNILTIALKRYQSGKFGKISKAIRFPEYLNLACYMSATDDNSPIYRLYAVVVHLDVMNSSFSGHYICYVKDTQGKWYKADDSQVKPVSREKVMSKCAYMLLYARCSPRAPLSVRKMKTAQDAAREKKAKQMLADSGLVPLKEGSSLNRHQGDKAYTDYIVEDTCTLDKFLDTSCPMGESPSPSESSSLFSNSDAGSTSTVSTDSTDSTRNSTEYDYIFGALDQIFPCSHVPMPDENEPIIYSRWGSDLNSSYSGRDVNQAAEAERLRGVWVLGVENPSFLHTDQSRQQSSCGLTDQCRNIDETDYSARGGRPGVLLKRPTRDRAAQTFY